MYTCTLGLCTAVFSVQALCCYSSSSLHDLYIYCRMKVMMATGVSVGRGILVRTVNKLTSVLCIHHARMEETVPWYGQTHCMYVQ